MKLITMELCAEQDGEHFSVHDSTQTHGNSWADVYRGMVMLRDELNRQIEERRLCPFNPRRVRVDGPPIFGE
jgi:hypothetical protein